MQIELAILALIIGYLIGSISISRIVTRIAAPEVNLSKVKIQELGEEEEYFRKDISATTASMVLGPKLGGLIGILDIFKAFVPTLIVRLLFPDQPYYLFTGGGVMGGHIWPIYHRFRGGRGISPALGTFLAIDPLGVLATNLIALFLGFFVFRQFLVALLLGNWLMIPWLWVSKGEWKFGLFAFLINSMWLLASIPDFKVYTKARANGKIDLDSAREAMPMGRMMNKMMDRMGLSKKKKV